MAGDVTVAVVGKQISQTATGTTDFTETDFGPPKACIIICGDDHSDNTATRLESRVSIGFSDFTNDYCIVHQDEDASAKVDCDALKSNTSSYRKLSVDGNDFGIGTAGSITDGVRLTNSDAFAGLAPDAPHVTVIMFGGADLIVSLDSVSVNSSQDGTTVVTPGNALDADLVFFIGTDISGEDSANSGINNSFGVAHIDTSDHTTFVNRCMGWASDHNATEGAPASILHNDQCLGILTEAGAEDWGLELTAATSIAARSFSYTVTTRANGAGAGMECYALALDLDDRGSKVFSVDSPISGATWAVTGIGFKPQYVGLGVTRLTVENTALVDDANAGAHGISSNTGSGEETFHGWYNEDNNATTNTNNNFRSRVLDLRDDVATTVKQDHSHSSFDADGFTTTVNTEGDTTARKLLGWAIEEAAVVFAPDADAFRFYSDGTESGSSPKADEDTDIELDPTGDAQFHIRFRVQNQGSLAGVSTDDYALEVSKNSGSFAAVTGASSDVQSDTASGLTADGATTNRATNGIADGTGSFVAGEQEETNGVIEDHQLTASNFTEHVWACKLIDADLGGGDTLDFRVTLNGGTPGMTNSVTPRITTPLGDDLATKRINLDGNGMLLISGG